MLCHCPRDKISDANDVLFSVCAVAGLGGHAWGSFKFKGASQSFMWVLDVLRDRLPNARLMTYGSKTRLDGNESTQTLKDLGKLLRDEMRSVMRRRSQSVLSSTMSHLGNAFAVPSFFIAHSLGGLTVKEVTSSTKISNDPELKYRTGTITGKGESGIRQFLQKSPGRPILRCTQPRHACRSS